MNEAARMAAAIACDLMASTPIDPAHLRVCNVISLHIGHGKATRITSDRGDDCRQPPHGSNTPNANSQLPNPAWLLMRWGAPFVLLGSQVPDGPLSQAAGSRGC